MAKTPLFRTLQRLILSQAKVAAPSRSAGASALGRREVMGLGLALGGAGLTACGPAAAPVAECPPTETAFTPPPEAPPRGPEEVIVVGAGLAGIHCAYRLAQAGINVGVYEAAKRTGGRTHSEKMNGQVYEVGGELIDTSHSTMRMFAAEFDLQLDYLPRVLPEGVEFANQYYLGGKFVSGKQLADESKSLIALMDKYNLQLCNLTGDEYYEKRESLDKEVGSMRDFLKKAKTPTALSLAVEFAFVGEFGLELDELSAFALLDTFACVHDAPINAGGDFNPFGESDEVMHFRDGNQGPANAMSKHLEDSIHLSHELVCITKSEDGYQLDFKNGSEIVSVSAPQIVLALPFSVLRNVEIKGGAISTENWEVIRGVTYGTNSKLFAQLKSPQPWEAKGHDGTLVTDMKNQEKGSVESRQIHNVWDTGRGQGKSTAMWTNFVGGKAGLQAAQGSSDDQWFSLLGAPDAGTGLDGVYPGVAAGFAEQKKVASTTTGRMLWPLYKWTKGSYMATPVGGVALADSIPKQECSGGLYYCGEHTSDAFQGFMEGAAESGARAASDVLLALKCPEPTTLRVLQEQKRFASEKRLKSRRLAFR